MFIYYLLLATTIIVCVALFFVERNNMKLKARNRLLIRENHKLRLKQEKQEKHEDSSKG
jgi:hypothetical protein